MYYIKAEYAEAPPVNFKPMVCKICFFFGNYWSVIVCNRKLVEGEYVIFFNIKHVCKL